MTNPKLNTVHVDLAERSYDARIGAALFGSLPDAAIAALGTPLRAACIVIDANTRPHAAIVTRALRAAGVQTVETEIHATEKNKSLDTLRRILTAMGEARVERADPVIAIGGGITCDLAGFAAATYRRGVPVIQCPTTLLAMVDASVGGKTGVNLDVAGSLQKNMVGAFHQPALVTADIDTLATLPDREFRAGLAECIKHGLIDNASPDGSHLAWIERSLSQILAREPDALIELITRSVRFKAAVVCADERETAQTGGGRALLNLGHTFAHAIETLHHLSPTDNPADAPLLHGEAVALGLIAAAATAAHAGLAPDRLPHYITDLLTRCGLPTSIAGLPDHEHILALMGADKKTSGGKLRLVLPGPERCATVVDDLECAPILAGLEAISLV